jgi:predicted small secreted protein
VPEATQVNFYTAQAYDQVNNSGYDRFKLTSTNGAVFNDPGYDYDFRIESNSQSYAFFVDASTGGIRSDVYDFQINNQDDGPALTLMSGRDYNSFLMGAAANYGSNNSAENKWSWNWRGRGSASTQHYNFLYDEIGNKEMFRVQADASQTVVVVNDGSNDIDFRVESDANAHAFFVDASNSFVKSGVAHHVGNTSTGLYSSGEGVGLYAPNAYSGCGAHLEIGTDAADGWSCVYMNRSWSSGNDERMMQFAVNGTVVGTITSNSTTTSYVTSSDHRLKENVVNLTGATTRLKQLSPKRFNFIADADTTVDGFIAHEVQSIVPEAITGTHNQVDTDGNPVYQGIDQSKLVPLLVATIKELEARITALENA